MPFPSRPLRSASLALALALPLSAYSQSTLFRITDLDLRDPHLYVNFVGCNDFTDSDSFGVSFNGSVQSEIQADSDADGALDLSYLLSFMPLAQQAATNFLAVGSGTCSAPIESTACGNIETPFFAGDATLDASATCLEPLAGTTRPYSPAIVSAGPACFVGPPVDITLYLAEIPLTLRDAQIAATFVGSPADQLGNGLLRGFITQSDADNTLLPAGFPLVGGQPLSVLLPGGNGNCAAHDDKDTNEVSGWWFYFNFSAARVIDTFENGFRDGFEGTP
jgi:hypothetical protein